MEIKQRLIPHKVRELREYKEGLDEKQTILGRPNDQYDCNL